MEKRKAFRSLFQPGTIGGLRLKNRVIRAPMATGLSGRDGSVTQRLVSYYEELARGGSGLIIVEYAWTDKKASKAAACQLGIADDECIPGLAWLAQRIKENGARAGLQIGHCGRQKMLGIPPIKAPSPVPWEELYQRVGPQMIPEELTIPEIYEIIETHGDAARRALAAGFDLLEIHGAHGYLITNFLSPRTNKRTDWFGGSLENRMRFLIEIIKNVRAKVGRDFPLSVRLSGTEYEPDGTTIAETVAVAKAITRLGVDVIHVSGGNHHRIMYEVSPMGMPLGLHVAAAETVKKAVSVPVVASGSITMPDLAEEILAAGKADFIGLARPLLADPSWPNKARAGRVADIRPCIRCNDGCRDRGSGHNCSICCTVNVAVTKETELTIKPAEHARNVAIIGAGPAGMEAARVCALRGHRVTMFEKRRLGGALVQASVPPFKADIRPWLAYMTNQIAQLEVKVVQEEATAATIKQGGFDAVIVATGGKQTRPPVPGFDQANVVTALEVLDGAVLGQKVLIVGGGMVAAEVGLFLAQQGKEVVIVYRGDVIMRRVERGARDFYLQELARHETQVHTGKRIEAVEGNTVRVIDSYGMRSEVLADNVVLATGVAPQGALAEQLERETELEVYAVGDCVKPRQIFDAIHEGHLVARLI